MFASRPDGAEIAWESTGSGPAVLLIMGLAYPGASWFRQVPALAERYRVLTIDNRGSGDTGDAVGAPYTVELMTGDCLAVLDAAGEERAHVVGISMGSLMAQELALTAPERVLSLTLMAAHPGVSNAVWPEEVTAFMGARLGMSPEESREFSIPFNYAPTTARELIEEDWALRAKGTATPVGYAAQGGTALWSGLDRLPGLRVPTLVVQGELDRLVVPANADLLVNAIPGAQLTVVPGANHVLTTDQPELVNRVLLDWFDAHPSSQPAS